MLRHVSNYEPKIIYCKQTDGKYDGKFSAQINTADLNSCVVCVKADITTESGNKYTSYHTKNTCSDTMETVSKPLFNGETLEISLAESTSDMSWYSGENTNIKVQFTLYQGNINDISSGGTIDLSAHDMLSDNKLCNSRVSATTAETDIENCVRIGNKIDYIDNTCTIVAKGTTYKVVSYDYESGNLCLNPSPESLESQDKVAIYTPFITCPAEKLEIRKYIENPLTIGHEFNNTKNYVYGKYTGTSLIKWYRWTIDDKYQSQKIYSASIDAESNKEFIYNLYYPAKKYMLEICTTDNKIYVAEQTTDYSVDDKLYIKSALNDTEITIYAKADVNSWCTILAIEGNNIRIVGHKEAGSTKYTEEIKIKDYCQNADNLIKYCVLMPYEKPDGTNGLRAYITDNYNANNKGIVLQELTKAGNHLYHIGEKNICFSSVDSGTDIKTNAGINVFEISSQPTIIKSEQDYEEGSCSADLLGIDNGEIIDNIERINLLKSIIKSDSPYLLKDQKGEYFVIGITDAGSRSYDKENLLTSITFSWKEIDKYDKCFIFEV